MGLVRILDISKSGAWRGTDILYLRRTLGLAKTLVILLDKLNISSVRDFGCGNDGYVEASINSGIKTYGFDGNLDTRKLNTPGDHCIGPLDVTSLQSWNQKDAAVSIELEEVRSHHVMDTYLTNLVNNAQKLVILSWGRSGQGGEGQVNGQTAKDLEEKMKKYGSKTNKRHTFFLHAICNKYSINNIKSNVQVSKKCDSGNECTPT